MSDNTRRDFLTSTAAVAAASTFAAPAILRAQNLNDRVRVAVVGMGGRSNAHGQSLFELEQEGSQAVDFAGVCDCNQAKLDNAVKAWSNRTGHNVIGYDDMRRVFDDDSIDAVTFATPNTKKALLSRIQATFETGLPLAAHASVMTFPPRFSRGTCHRRFATLPTSPTASTTRCTSTTRRRRFATTRNLMGC